MVWKPHVIVAAVIERDQRFLLVEEETPYGLQFNQPAGHLEDQEDLISAVKREVLEETGWQFFPQALVGVQLWRKQRQSPTFLRFCFTGPCDYYDANRPLDTGIVGTHWLNRDDLLAQEARWRSPLVMTCIDEYLAGRRYPLSLITSILNDE